VFQLIFLPFLFFVCHIVAFPICGFGTGDKKFTALTETGRFTVVSKNGTSGYIRAYLSLMQLPIS
jgi:hypothetical protein